MHAGRLMHVVKEKADEGVDVFGLAFAIAEAAEAEARESIAVVADTAGLVDVALKIRESAWMSPAEAAALLLPAG